MGFKNKNLYWNFGLLFQRIFVIVLCAMHKTYRTMKTTKIYALLALLMITGVTNAQESAFEGE